MSMCSLLKKVEFALKNIYIITLDTSIVYRKAKCMTFFTLEVDSKRILHYTIARVFKVWGAPILGLALICIKNALNKINNIPCKVFGCCTIYIHFEL